MRIRGRDESKTKNSMDQKGQSNFSRKRRNFIGQRDRLRQQNRQIGRRQLELLFAVFYQNLIEIFFNFKPFFS